MNEFRALDANINRSCEGLRVLEDLARFHFDDQKISSELRNIRHQIRDLLNHRTSQLLSFRDADHDVGQTTSNTDLSDQRKNLKSVALSNFKRVQEALRSMEELLKVMDDYHTGKKMEAIRFSTYSLEKRFLLLFPLKRVPKDFPTGVYGILGEKFSLGRTNLEMARLMVEAGVDILQYREKANDKSFKEMLEECYQIREITRKAGVPFIINDHIAIAMLVDADGVHQGQDDLPVKAVRKLLPDMMIGCSTHTPEQAEKAIKDGADYIGVGPVFTTQTKKDVCDAVGFEYLDHVVANHDIPFVAIGGIKCHNLKKVVKHGAKTICLVTEIIGAKNIEQRMNKIKKIIGESK